MEWQSWYALYTRHEERVQDALVISTVTQLLALSCARCDIAPSSVLVSFCWYQTARNRLKGRLGLNATSRGSIASVISLVFISVVKTARNRLKGQLGLNATSRGSSASIAAFNPIRFPSISNAASIGSDATTWIQCAHGAALVRGGNNETLFPKLPGWLRRT